MAFIEIVKQKYHQRPLRVADIDLSETEKELKNVIALSPNVLHYVPIFQRNANCLSLEFSF